MNLGRYTVVTSGAEMVALDVLDHEVVEWERVSRSAFLVHQHFRYEYPGPIEDLRHRLVIIPPEQHLDQRRLMHRLDISAPDAEFHAHHDRFGNEVIEVLLPSVERSIDFEAWVAVERRLHGNGAEAIGGRDPFWTESTARTEPDEALRATAEALQSLDRGPIDLAREINAWVYGHMRYMHGITDIHTTAAEAFALGQGVCQDYAHIMLALCHACGIPARYVSGHLLGEGGTHAWVEVLCNDDDGAARVWPFDPTHGRQPGLSYVTVAVGRDYGDVAPTSGTYRAPFRGNLSSLKRVGITAVEYE